MKLASKSGTAFVNALALAVALWAASGVSAGAEWKVETVDQSGAGRFTSMKIDTNGNVHVVYVPEADMHPLKYAYWDHTLDKWFTMTIANYASFCTLALDSNQRPHVSYATHGTGKGAKLHYIYWKGGAQWEDRPISPAGDAVVGYYTGIALDSKDSPSFSYYDYEGPAGVGFMLRMRSVFWNGKFWEVRMVDRQPGSGKFNSIAVDSKGHPHIAYANVKAEFASLRYASWDGESWHTEKLEGLTGPRPIFSVALIMDKGDNPHITYSDVDNHLVKYATRRGGQWVIQTVDSVNRVGYPDRNGIALDEQGNVYLSYYDSGDGVLKVASSRNGKWYIETLARDFAGFTSSIAVHDGMLWVSYADDAAASFKVAHRPLEEPAAVVPEVTAAKAAAKAGK